MLSAVMRWNWLWHELNFVKSCGRSRAPTGAGVSLLAWLINVGLGVACGLACVAGVLCALIVLGGIGAALFAAIGMAVPTIIYIGFGSVVLLAVLAALGGVCKHLLLELLDPGVPASERSHHNARRRVSASRAAKRRLALVAVYGAYDQMLSCVPCGTWT